MNKDPNDCTDWLESLDFGLLLEVLDVLLATSISIMFIEMTHSEGCLHVVHSHSAVHALKSNIPFLRDTLVRAVAGSKEQ